MKRNALPEHPMCVEPNFYSHRDREDAPGADRIREEAILAGGMDPFAMRFRVVEYEKATGERLRIQLYDLGFVEALEKTQTLIQRNDASHFCLEPIGFLQ